MASDRYLQRYGIQVYPITVVGCGFYSNFLATEMTGFKGDIFADPSRELYHKLGMTTENLKFTPAGQEKKSYVPSSFWLNVVKSNWVNRSSFPHLFYVAYHFCAHRELLCTSRRSESRETFLSLVGISYLVQVGVRSLE